MSAPTPLTASQYRRHVVFAAVNVTVGRELVLPAIRRLLVVDATVAAAALVIRQGTATVIVPAGASQLLHTPGTADGLVAVAPAVQAGAPAAPVDETGTPAPPTDIQGEGGIGGHQG